MRKVEHSTKDERRVRSQGIDEEVMRKQVLEQECGLIGQRFEQDESEEGGSKMAFCCMGIEESKKERDYPAMLLPFATYDKLGYMWLSSRDPVQFS